CRPQGGAPPRARGGAGARCARSRRKTRHDRRRRRGPAGARRMTGGMGAKFKAAGFAVLPLALMLAGCKVWFSDVPVDVYVQGFIMGLLMSLISVGLVIVYRANRITNSAAAVLGSPPATFGFLLFASFGWTLSLSTFIGLGSAVILGIVVEFLFLRRFFEAPRLIMTVATIGVTQLLVALGLFLPIWMGSPDANRGTYQFFDITFHIGETPFGS